MKKLLLIAFLSLCGSCWATDQEGSISSFGGLNDTDNPLIIGANQAQAILNVEKTPGGKAVKKRKGFGLAYNTAVTTSPVHGVYSFYDSNGNSVALAFNDKFLTSSVGGGAAATLFSTGTLGATWQCTDSLGFAYCASSSRDPIIKTNGATYSNLSTPSTGTMVTATAQRLATAGFASSPSQIYLSKANDFSTWTTGALATDAYYDTISAPGSRITHITYACDNLMWFKDSSFGMILNSDDQFNAEIRTISPTIGTLDNSSVYYNGVLHFRAQDGHFYDYDCSSLQKMTKDLQGTISVSAQRRSNAWAQTSKSEFETGSIVPTGNLSTLISAGDVTVSSFGVVENSSTAWANGTSSNVSVWPSSITLTINNSGNIDDNSFEGTPSTYWTITSNAGPSITSQQLPSDGASCPSFPACDGTRVLFMARGSPSNVSTTVELLDLDNNVLGSGTLDYSSAHCTCQTVTITPSASNLGKRFKFKLTATDGNGTNTVTSKHSWVLGGNVTFQYANSTVSQGSSFIDNVLLGSSTISLGSFTSKIYDTGFTSSIYQFQTNFTINTSTPSFALLTSTSPTGIFTTILTSTGTNAAGNRYAKYTSTISIGSSDNALTSISTFTIISRSTGTYYSAIKNASGLTSWDTFLSSKQENGGSISFYTRASTNTFSVTSSTPAWVSQTINGTVSASTGTYFQARVDFAIDAATQTPTLNDFTFNWYEGTASDKVYGTYFDNAVWWSVQKGTGTTSNNSILRYELENNDWTIFDIPANGFYSIGNSLYFGSSVYGKVYKYGDADSDDGSAINSYWKSKDFVGNGPFTENELRKISVAAKMVANSSMTVTYTIDSSSSVAYTVPLTRSRSGTIKNNRLFPAGTNGTTFNFQAGNNAADQYWELYGIGYSFEPKPWKSGN